MLVLSIIALIESIVASISTARWLHRADATRGSGAALAALAVLVAGAAVHILQAAAGPGIVQATLGLIFAPV